MTERSTAKKHIVTSYRNLTPEMQDAIREQYPLGFTDAMMRVDKPNGDFFYAVPYDTDEVAYLVKIDVKVDDNAQEEDDKDYYDDELKGAEDLQDEGNSGDDSDDDWPFLPAPFPPSAVSALFSVPVRPCDQRAASVVRCFE